jgi:biopolymer transport protein ExbD
MRLPPVEEDIEGLNLTPVIDVVFLLLIFFLVASQFAREEREVDTRLPQVVEARPLASGNRQIIVNVNQRGEFIVAGQRYTAEQLAGLLQQESRKNPDMQTVQIRADERVPFRFPAQVMGLCERQGIKHLCAVELAKRVFPGNQEAQP